jgi:hypothetical protein
MRWNYLRECSEHAQHNVAVATVVGIAMVISVWTEWVEPFFVAPSLSLHHKLPFSWAIVIFLAGLFFTTLEGSYRLLHESVRSELLPSDPLLYFDVVDERNSFHHYVGFKVENRGGGVAHHISISPLETSRGRAAFEPIDSLDAKAECRAVPKILGAGLFQHDLINLIRHELNDLHIGGNRKDEFVRQLFATYRDFTGRRCIKVYFDLVYHPYNDAMRDAHNAGPARAPELQRVICEVRHRKWDVIPC